MVYTDEGNIHLDHALNITLPALSSSVECALSKSFKSFERCCRDISHSIAIVGYAAAAYLVMAGLSRLMEARNKSLPPPYPHYSDEYQKKSKRKSKKKNAKEGVKHDGEEEAGEIQESENDIEADDL